MDRRLSNCRPEAARTLHLGSSIFCPSRQLPRFHGEIVAMDHVWSVFSIVGFLVSYVLSSRLNIGAGGYEDAPSVGKIDRDHAGRSG
jgi:hypothetical protein